MKKYFIHRVDKHIKSITLWLTMRIVKVQMMIKTRAYLVQLTLKGTLQWRQILTYIQLILTVRGRSEAEKK